MQMIRSRRFFGASSVFIGTAVASWGRLMLLRGLRSPRFSAVFCAEESLFRRISVTEGVD